MTAVIYARYSSDNQREESIEGQIRECTAYTEKNGITVVKHYIDRALSAKTDNRPDFQQMIKDSEKRLFDIVLVWKLDRFARNRYDSAHYEYQLERNHVKLVSATEPISDSPAGIMVKSMLTGMAEYYSAELSEKVVRGMTENVLKGKYNGGTIPIETVLFTGNEANLTAGTTAKPCHAGAGAGGVARKTLQALNQITVLFEIGGCHWPACMASGAPPDLFAGTKKEKHHTSYEVQCFLVENSGIEPLTSCMPCKRSPEPRTHAPPHKGARINDIQR